MWEIHSDATWHGSPSSADNFCVVSRVIHPQRTMWLASGHQWPWTMANLRYRGQHWVNFPCSENVKHLSKLALPIPMISQQIAMKFQGNPLKSRDLSEKFCHSLVISSPIPSSLMVTIQSRGTHQFRPPDPFPQVVYRRASPPPQKKKHVPQINHHLDA